MTGFNFIPRTDRLIVSLEAYYDGFDEDRSGSKQCWSIACNKFFVHRAHNAYLRPFYQMKVLKTHPLLLGCGAKTYFSVQGTCKDVALLMGELFLVHQRISGNWVQFHEIFSFLPGILETQSENQLAAPTPLIEHYFEVMQRHEIKCITKSTQKDWRNLSLLLFTSVDFSDNYDFGQPFIAAESFELIEGA
jgi:hypothetical protein